MTFNSKCKRPAPPAPAGAPPPRRVIRAPRFPVAGIRLPSLPEGLRHSPVFRAAFFAFGLLAIAALGMDLAQRFRHGPPRPPAPAGPEAFVLGIRDRVYRDPEGRFEVTVPASWLLRGPETGRHDMVFLGPMNLEGRIQVTRLTHERFDRLLQDIYAIEEQWGVHMNIRAFTHGTRPIVERRVRLMEQKVLAYDFLDGPIGHHIQFAAPRDDFDRFEPLFQDIFATYIALRPGSDPEQETQGPGSGSPGSQP